VKNQGKKLMSFRAFSIGFSAALLALACGSEDSNNGEGTIDPPEVPSGEDACRDNPLAEDGDDNGGNDVTGEPTDEPVDEPVDQPGDNGGDPDDIERAAVEGILAEYCGTCHGPALTEQAAQAGMNYITDLDRLAQEQKLIPGDSAGSQIIQYMRDGVMPPGSLEKVPTDDIQRVADFIDNPNYWDIQPEISCADSGQQIDFDQLFQEINDDLSGEDADDQANYRYLVLTNRYNAGVCNDTQLDRDRQALVKMVNMLSTAPTIEEPFDVNGEGLIYRIDLRDYEWDRAITINGENFNDVWEGIAANNPYAVAFVGDDADDAVADTGTFPVHVR
jgi:hypothetical protein